MRDWHAAFGASNLLVLRVEDLLDTPEQSRDTILRFIGLRGPAAGPASRGYAAVHAASLNASSAMPMRRDTRALLEKFYRPHNRRLASMLRKPFGFEHSMTIDARAIARPELYCTGRGGTGGTFCVQE